MTALVTGGARGLGASIVQELANNGATVIIADILVELGNSLVNTLNSQGMSAWFSYLDVTEESQWIKTVSKIENEFGHLDIVVNNAGMIVRKCLSEMSLEEWNRALSVNLTSIFLSVKHCRRLLRSSNSARIVNISSTAGIIAHHDPSYTASKWAVRGLTKSVALELMEDGIRINSVHPSMISTPLTEAAPVGHIEANQYAIPLGRAAEPEEIAYVVAFLCSPRNSYMTGSEVVVDGGMTCAGVAHMRAQFQKQFVLQTE